MRIFNELVVDDYVSDTNNHIASVHWAATIGNVDNLRVMVIADRVSGVGPVVNVAFSETPDLATTKTNVTSFPILAQPILAGQTNILAGASDLTLPMSYAPFLVYGLAGTSPSAHLRIWVTGRGRA